MLQLVVVFHLKVTLVAGATAKEVSGKPYVDVDPRLIAVDCDATLVRLAVVLIR